MTKAGCRSGFAFRKFAESAPKTHQQFSFSLNRTGFSANGTTFSLKGTGSTGCERLTGPLVLTRHPGKLIRGLL